MQKIVKCNKADYTTLSAIWERSVRATHDFLNEDTITGQYARISITDKNLRLFHTSEIFIGAISAPNSART